MNACMMRDTRQDIEEEVVDAVFNNLVLLMKCAKADDRAKADEAYDMLMSLSGVFSDLEAFKRFSE